MNIAARCREALHSGVKKFQSLKPDVVLLDLSMPDINGIEAAKLMSAANPRARFCVTRFKSLRNRRVFCSIPIAGSRKQSTYAAASFSIFSKSSQIRTFFS
jgi:CheY-like chemotaxis protein